MFIEKVSGINPVSTLAVSVSVIVKFKILRLVETLQWWNVNPKIELI